MVICGPCVVMMPSNYRHGPFQRENTSNIPLPVTSDSKIPKYNVSVNPVNVVSKLPQPSSSHKFNQTVDKTTSSIAVKNQYSHEAYPNLKMSVPDQRNPPSVRGRTNNNSSLAYNSKKTESLVIANEQGKYVGTKPLKPVTLKKLGFHNPPISSTSKGEPNQGINLSSKLSRPNEIPRPRNNEANAMKRFSIHSPEKAKALEEGKSFGKGKGVGKTTKREDTPSNKCIASESQNSVRDNFRTSSTFIPSPNMTSTNRYSQRSSTNKSNILNPITVYKNKPSGALLSKNHRSLSSATFPRDTQAKNVELSTNVHKRFRNTSIIESANTRIPKTCESYDSATNVDKEEFPSLRGRKHTLNGCKLGLKENQLKRRLRNERNESSAVRPKSTTSYQDVRRQFPGYPPAIPEAKFESSDEEKELEENMQCHKDSKNHNVKQASNDVEGDVSPKDILDFSIESGEESPCDESMIQEENFELEDNCFYSVDNEASSEEEFMNHKDIVTVINTCEAMAQSNDTTIDSSLNSWDENNLELLPETNSSSFQDTEDGVQEEQYSNPEVSPDSSTDDFLVQSFQQLQQEVEDHQALNTNGYLSSSNTSKNLTVPFVFRRGNESPNVSIEDESDYIEIDCDVQPMPALNRPLVYGYGNRLPMRSRNSMPIHRFSCHQNGFDHNFETQQSNSPIQIQSRNNPIVSDMKETYWDYYLAKNKNNDINKIDNYKSTVDMKETHCHNAKEICYDPEILLAQLAHPKSLKNATFSEYSAHIKSSIMERYASHYSTNNTPDNEVGYGSCFDLNEKSRPVSANDPGYYSESDITKFKNHHTSSEEQSKTRHLDKDYDSYPSYPSLPRHLKYDSIPYTSSKKYIGDSLAGNDHLFSASHDNLKVGDNKIFQPSHYGYYENPSCGPLGVNPWLHLLPEISPHRSSNGTPATNYDCETSTPIQENINKSIDDEIPPSTDQPKIKSQRKSFLPSFLKKRKCSKSDKPLSSDSSYKLKHDKVKPESLDLSKDYQNRVISAHIASELNRPDYTKKFASPKVAEILRDSLTLASPASENSSSSSSSSTKSSQSATSQDSVLTVISAKCS